MPPDALQPVMRQLVDQFVHDRARPEVITVGIKTVREICVRAPLVMNQELLVRYEDSTGTVIVGGLRRLTIDVGQRSVA